MKVLRSGLFVLLIISLICAHLTTSSDLNQDLSRHLKLGEIISRTYTVPATNLFSYTNTTYPFINHHWLSELIFYTLSHWFGINSLILFKTLLIMLAVLVVTLIPRIQLRATSLISALVLSPLLLERSDIRPELIGYVLFAFTLFIFFSYQKYPKLLYALPVVMVLWVNVHITFVFGMFLLGLLTIKLFKQQKVILTFSWLAFLLNPSFLYGALYPFLILRNYSYPIIENQNIFLIARSMFNPFIWYFFILSPITLLAIVTLLRKKRIWQALILSVFTGLTCFQLRHMPFFILAAIPAYAESFFLFQFWLKKNAVKEIYHLSKILILSWTIILTLIWIWLLASNSLFRAFDKNKRIGFGFSEDGIAATDFVLSHKLERRIFNNFDNGGELIYRLYPKYSVFIDNRPEAYDPDFVQGLYIPMQTNSEIASIVFKRFNIRTIIFAHTDEAAWAKQFARTILSDPNWRLIFVDGTTMVLSRATNLPDIRSNKTYLMHQIQSETSSSNLLYFANILVNLRQPLLASQAFNRAAKLNPDSCAINRNLYIIKKSEGTKKKYWYCFL